MALIHSVAQCSSSNLSKFDDILASGDGRLTQLFAVAAGLVSILITSIGTVDDGYSSLVHLNWACSSGAGRCCVSTDNSPVCMTGLDLDRITSESKSGLHVVVSMKNNNSTLTLSSRSLPN